MRGSFFLPLPPILLPFLVVPVGLLVAMLPVFNVFALVFEVVLTVAIVLFPAVLLAVLFAVPMVVCPRATVAVFFFFSPPCAASCAAAKIDSTDGACRDALL